MEETAAEHWSERLNRTARLRGVSIAALARQIGVSYERLIKCAQGKVDQPRGPLMEDIARALSVRLPWLRYGEGPMEEDAAVTAPALSEGQPARYAADGVAPAGIGVDGARQWPKNLPVLGTAAGSETGAMQLEQTVIDYVRRPPGLEAVGDAYGIYVIGDSMEPKYPNGDLVLVHPHRPPRPGDDVVLQIQNGPDQPAEAFLKHLVRQTADTITVRQYNPEKELVFDRQQVVAMHKVMPLHELLGF